jgi:hypothetical protein
MKDFRRAGCVMVLLGLIGLGGGTPVRAGSILINFDTDASGNPITAPSDFNDATALTTLYAPLGVTFSGPGGNDGGAILNAGAPTPPPDDNPGGGGPPIPDFGVFAHSGTNVLAFNRNAILPGDDESNGGVPRDPETVTFSKGWTNVSIYAAGGFESSTFTINGYDAHGALVGSVTLTMQDWAQLRLHSLDPITSIVLKETTSDPNAGNAFLYDDLLLSSSAVPEPGSLLLLGTGIAGMSAFAGNRLIARTRLRGRRGTR